MSFYCSTANELFWTEFTWVWFFTSVIPFMSFFTPRVLEFFVTKLTGIWSFVWVNPLMSGQSLWHFKALVTNFTFEWLFVFMDRGNMIFHYRLCTEAQTANFTLEWFHSSMKRSNMPLQSIYLPTSVFTYFTSEFVLFSWTVATCSFMYPFWEQL